MKASALVVCARADRSWFWRAALLFSCLSCVLVCTPLAKAQELEQDPAVFAAAEQATCLSLLESARARAVAQMQVFLLSTSEPEANVVARATCVLARTVQVCAWLENEQAMAEAKVLARLGLQLLEGLAVSEEEAADVQYWKAHLLGTYLERTKAARSLAHEGAQRWPDQDRFVELEFALFKKQGARRR